MNLPAGLYEQIINIALKEKLSEFPESCKKIAPIDTTLSPKIFASYLADVIQKSLDILADNDENLSSQINLVNQIITLIEKSTQTDNLKSLEVPNPAEQLLALLQKNDPNLAAGKTAEHVIRPETSIAQSSLFTGAVHEPQMFSELKKEIVSANRIDMLVSFIKWSGLRLIINELKKFTENGGNLRVITTSYMGATDVKAIEELRKLPNTQIKISYDTTRTRLHAKTYVFYRDTGFTTAYVGSSNLSNAAISSGLEWNVKVTQKDLPETIKKIDATFDCYWNSNEFEIYSEGEKERLAHALLSEKYFEKNSDFFSMEISPYSYQQEILDKLSAERTVRNFFRNLVVAATGTGKTVISALDYKRFQKENPHKNRLLFVAHRAEILRQSLNTFRAVLKDGNFGEMFVGTYKPQSMDHLFVSIQTLNSQDLTKKIESDFYDFIVVDEFHHAASPSYKKLLEYFNPKILLGLTATPERMDGKSILEYFNNRIAAEIRLPEAIDRKLLCPFQYFGVTDNVDLQSLRWTAGGYDRHELSNVYALNRVVAERRADLVVNSILKYVTAIDDVKGLGFCVSIEHAEFMAEYFNSHKIPSMHLTGKSTDEERFNAKAKLVSGEVRFIFVVDIYNEGVDIPEVNTVLFLRPTESLTVFLQQLGRGLRLSKEKDCLTVLDFIGQANKKYNFEEKFAALLSNTRHSVTKEIKDGFISAPKGCYIQLEKVAADHILQNIKSAYGNSSALVNKIANFLDDTGLELTLENFLNYYHIDPKSIYKSNSFSRLCVKAGVVKNFNEPLEEILTKSFLRFAAVDSRRFIVFLQDFLIRLQNKEFSIFSFLSEMEKRMVQMFYVTIWGSYIDDFNGPLFLKNMEQLSECPALLSELKELLQYQFNRIDFIDQPVDLGFNCPLDLHCTYSRDQLLVALDFMKPNSVREGVKWLSEKNLDVLFVTLNKSDKDYSPTTLYNDYSINETFFHWQSQSTTTEISKTGQRYIHHKKEGSKVLLFVREYKADEISKSASPYTFLGTANYVSHQGSAPMNITWELDAAIPAKFLKKTNKLMVG